MELLIPVIRKETKKYLHDLDARSEDEIPVVDRKTVRRREKKG